MEWLGQYLQDKQAGYIALAVIGGALGVAVLMTLVTAWLNWRAVRLARLARRFHGRRKLATEVIASLDAEEKDLKRLMREMDRAVAKG